MPNIYERATISAFQQTVDQGIENPKVQLKSIERRMRAIQDSDTVASFEELIKVLGSGLQVQLGNQQFIAQIENLQVIASRGLIKKLSRKVDKKTKNPKTSRGTVWRRNSTVQERRRISPTWSDGSIARTEAKRRSSVVLTPYDDWVSAEQQRLAEQRRNQVEVIQGKKEKRNYKKLLEQEMNRRLEEYKTEEQCLAEDFMNILEDITEKDGIANQPELESRVLKCTETRRPVPIFFIWGPPYEGQAFDDVFLDGTAENQMAFEIELVLSQLASTGVAVQPYLLYADAYGTEINCMDTSGVDRYYQQLVKRFENKVVPVRWSNLKAENKLSYTQLAQEFSASSQLVSSENIENAKKIQQKLGGNFSLNRAKSLAQRYKLERYIEGEMLTQGVCINGVMVKDIIKLATAPSRSKNDDPYEVNLPRFYVKNMTRAAWNKARR